MFDSFNKFASLKAHQIFLLYGTTTCTCTLRKHPLLAVSAHVHTCTLPFQRGQCSCFHMDVITLGTCTSVIVIILCVCLFVTALARTYDVCATKLAYQCNLRCTQKVLKWAFSLKSFLPRVIACFRFALPNGRPFWNIEVATWTSIDDHYQN